MPTKNSTRHPANPAKTAAAPGGIQRLMSEPMMLPVADSVCSTPSASARNWPSGTLSATSVVAAPNMPPTPSPTRNRYSVNSTHVCASPERPVNTEYTSSVMTIVFTRPTLSLITPKSTPPVAHPRIIEVVA